jgi:hypothetical protein
MSEIGLDAHTVRDSIVLYHSFSQYIVETLPPVVFPIELQGNRRTNSIQEYSKMHSSISVLCDDMLYAKLSK